MTTNRFHALRFAQMSGYAPMPKKEAPKASTVEKPVNLVKSATVPASATAPRGPALIRKLDFSHLGALSQDQISRMQAAIRFPK